MATLHTFGGEKGGVGKSFVCRTANQYHIDRGIEFTLFDADRSNPDVKRIYKESGCREAIFSEKEKYEDKANSIYLSAVEHRTLVNLPAQIFVPFKEWFEKNELFEVAQEDGVTFYHWFVCDGGYDSLKLLYKTLQCFKGRVQHVLVKNWGRCDDWAGLTDNDHLTGLIKDYQVKIVDFPKFIGNADRNDIDAKSLTFGEARTHSAFNSISRQRVKSFLNKAYEAFDSAGVF